MHPFKKMIYMLRRDSLIPPPETELTITASSPILEGALAGTGTLDFLNGEPFEVLDLSFVVSPAVDFDSLEFSAPISVPMVDSTHLIRTGYVTLDASGVASSGYAYMPISPLDSICIATITGRSSAVAIPTINSVNF
jgi:hypothetical protein